MGDWDRLQHAPTKEIVASVFDRMDGRSDADPLAPWADGVLALCERIDARDRRISTLEARLRWALQSLPGVRPGKLNWKRGRVWSCRRAPSSRGGGR